MDVVVYALCKKLVSNAISSLGDVFTLKGNVASYDDLPTSGNKAGDIYLVGPQLDDSYDEYYWTSNENWEPMGSTGPDMSQYITKETLYEGEDGTGTVEDPAPGTILFEVNKSAQPQVFFWKPDFGTGYNNTITLWNKIREINKLQECLVITTGDDSWDKIIFTIPKEALNETGAQIEGYRYVVSEDINSSETGLVTYILRLTFTIVDDAVTRVTRERDYDSHYFIDTTTDYSDPYMPEYDGSPATKKYVDDVKSGIESEYDLEII